MVIEFQWRWHRSNSEYNLAEMILIKKWVNRLYVISYNLLFAGWRYIGEGHYHYFEEKIKSD